MKEQLKASLKDAMKAKDKIKLDTIRSVLSAIQYEEMQKGCRADIGNRHNRNSPTRD